ncbi:MAG TPA: hypothetical protein VIT24_05005, partial [Acidimicrobiales bacterium]
SAHDDESGHQRRYTNAGLRSVVEAAGFTVERQTSFFSALLGPMALRRLVRRSPREGDAAAEVTDPTGGDGALAAGLERLLAHERRSLRRRDRRTGTSILLVARRG